MNYFGTAEHAGTHLDSPAHFYKDRNRTHNVPLENLIGPGVIINVKNKAAMNADYQVSIDDLKQWESMYDKIPENAIIIMNSGWHEHYPNASLVFNTDSLTDSSTFHFPCWHEDTIEWLISERSVNVVGVDTPSTDFGQTQNFAVHISLGKANISGAENVANLDAIPESGSMIFVAVTKIYDESGGPARIFATIPMKVTSFGWTFGPSFVLFLSALCIFIPLIAYLSQRAR
ncbi:isatin hydrolase-like [Mytilus californianus]|uniref:isatin hydrolase-like n=1 Tax=Mytilus californianus TaxID=6549 RepID=UPI002247D5BA|nr:isatin hydrolase-like [Mytilus californianus]